MSTAIALNYGISDASTCLQEVVPNTCQTGFMTTMKGLQLPTGPLQERVYGMQIKNWQAGKLPQQWGPSLYPEYFGGQCSSLYCKDAQMCPGNRNAKACSQTQDMLDYLFPRESNEIGNSAPPSVLIGPKCGATYDSVAGWEINNQGTGLKWQMQSQGSSCGNTL